MRARSSLPCVLLVLAVLAPGRTGSAQPPSLEHEIKAAFLYNFVRFIVWPADAFAGPEAPLSICLVGQDPFGPTLDELVANERVDGRPLAVRRLAAPSKDAACHLLFASPSERARFASILKAVDTRRVVVVTDALDLLPLGGHISFFMESNRVRFAVNADAVRQAEFQVNSRLMRLARIVEGGADPQ